MIKTFNYVFTNGKDGIISLILLDSNGKFSYGTYFTTTTPFLEFSIQFQSNNLIYDKGYNKRQQVIYSLILLLREEWLGYRMISYKLNDWGIKTHRGKKWFNTSVQSVLKRKHERDVLFDEIRNRHYPTEISKMIFFVWIRLSEIQDFAKSWGDG